MPQDLCVPSALEAPLECVETRAKHFSMHLPTLSNSKSLLMRPFRKWSQKTYISCSQAWMMSKPSVLNYRLDERQSGRAEENKCLEMEQCAPIIAGHIGAQSCKRDAAI